MVPDSLRDSKRFDFVRVLGKGGMGCVYLVHDRELGAKVALKTLARDDVTSLYRFKKEFRSLVDVSHENLVVLHELLCEDDAAWFLSMEYVDGQDFMSYLRGLDPLEWDPAVSTVKLGTPSRGDKPVGNPTGVALHGPHGEVGLRDAFAQLATGVQVLHDAGKLHKDLKPSNVMVTAEGRVVLLDFGMVVDQDDASRGQTIDDELMGTPAYVAPEQVAGPGAGPASDWYSFGVMLYEALTGKLPIEGRSIDIIARKQIDTPRLPSLIEPAVPPDLERLCMQLLERDPTLRPDGVEVLATLQPSLLPSLRVRTPAPEFEEVFIGRDGEFGVLREAFEATADGAPVAVLVEGPSGIGKSALLRHFMHSLDADEEAVVLRGRCYEQESVPFEAVDSLVDSLVRYLRSLRDVEAARLIPRNAAALARLFPVMLKVRVMARVRARVEVRDPIEVRRRGFAAFKELLGRIADERPLVLCIDDLQWGDTDGAALLAHALSPPDAAPVLLVATHRDQPGRVIEELTRVPELQLRRLRLGALSRGEVRAMVKSRFEALDEARLRAIEREAEGSPLFVNELLRSLSSEPEATESSPQVQITLERTVTDRIDSLSRNARELLRVVAVAGRPLRSSVALSAAGLGPESSTLWGALRSARLLLTRGASGEHHVLCFHQRVRDAVVGQLDGDALRDIHGKLARALEQAGFAESESIGDHYARAGDMERAVGHMREAAAAAIASLAFARAARLYRWLLDHGEPDAAERAHLEHALGDALANDSRGAEAAEAFLRARAGAGPELALELQRLAAEYFLRSGHLERGMQCLARVLEAVGLPAPASPARALASLVLRRANLRLRGLHFEERRAEEVPAELLMRIDVCWSAASGLGLIDFVLGGDFQARHLALALEAGEPFRVVRALALEAAYLAAEGTRSQQRTAEVVKLARDMADRIGDPHAQGLSLMANGMARWHAGGFRDALELCRQAERIFRERCTGATWEIVTSHVFQAAAQYWLGDLPALGRKGAAHLREALQNDDRFAAADLQTGYHVLPQLARDRVAPTRAAVAQQKRAWPNNGFHLQHWNQLQADCLIDLYEGRGARGLSRIERRWRELQRSQVMHVQVIAIEVMQLRAHCGLAAAHAQPRSRTRLLRGVVSFARKIAKVPAPWAEGLVLVIEGSVAEMRGQPALARQHFGRAVTLLEAFDMQLHAACARYRLGCVVGGREGEVECKRALQLLRDRGVKRPEQMVAVLAPGGGG